MDVPLPKDASPDAFSLTSDASSSMPGVVEATLALLMSQCRSFVRIGLPVSNKHKLTHHIKHYLIVFSWW